MLTSDIPSLEVFELKYLDRRHLFPSEHSPWAVVAQLHLQAWTSTPGKGTLDGHCTDLGADHALHVLHR
jgi:hypothetical protein